MSSLPLAAQCTLACPHPETAPANTSPDPTSCEVTLSVPSTGLASAGCTGPYDVLVINDADNSLIFAQQNLSLGDVFNIGILPEGTLIRVTYIHQPDGTSNQCTNYFLIVDEIPPTFASCNDATLACNVTFDAEDITVFPPTVDDNCFGSPVLTVTQLSQTDCNDMPAPPAGIVEVVTRRWTVSDPDLPGMTATCDQQISFTVPDLNLVTYPVDAVIDCAASADPAFAGIPQYDGTDIALNGIDRCQLGAVFSDDTLANCSANDYFITRTWTVTYWCDGTILNGTQNIAVQDNTPPAITCPADFTVGTSTQPGVCGATFLLPPATATDDCSGSTITVMSSTGAMGLGPYMNVSPGNFTATYTAEDDCGNTSNCVVTVTVIDDETPTPVCEEFTDVSLPSSGSAVVPACVFDSNNDCNNPSSYDDCAPIGFEASLDNINFSESLTFDCTQADSTFAVFLRVFELTNPSSSTVCMVMVTVEDKLNPQVICPVDPAPIDCETDISDLSVFGAPVINENCDFTLQSDSLISISQCGEGSITRTFTATDDSGNTGSCVQTITVENSTPFDGTGINFPADYTEINTCRDPSTLSPTDLNPDYLQDIFPAGGVSCAMLAVSFEDMFFDLNSPSCYKIIRTWQVIDWCQYDPDNPAAGGVWTDSQVIKILDDQAPIITAPDMITVAVDDNCAFGEVTDLMVSVTDGCNSNVTITNDFTNAIDGTANGMYPLGLTTVTFTADDVCGNTATAQVIVEVKDQKAPTLACYDNITTDLALMGSGGMVMANVNLFVYEANDNCTASGDLLFFMERNTGTQDNIPPNTTELPFTCDDKGPVELLIWVMDEVGNTETCSVTLQIQDNNNVCPDDNEDTEVTVAGILATEAGEEVEEAEVMLYSNSNAFPDITGFEGSYAFPDLPLGADYTVVPQKDGDDDNGITTWDIILIIRHINNMEPLDSPYKIIAADVNHSESVTMSDVVAIKRLILGMDTEFASNNSWRFVDMYYEFPNPANPWEENFPEVKQLQNLNTDEQAANFTAVKIGDINGSAAANFNDDSGEERSTGSDLIFRTKEQEFAAGENLSIEISAHHFKQIIGWQCSFDFSASALEFTGIESAALSEASLQYFEKSNSEINLTWSQLNAQNFTDEEVLFTLNFKALTTGKLSEVLHLSDRRLQTEAYRLPSNIASVEFSDIKLQFAQEELITTTQFALYQNQPNPVKTETMIAFDLPKASQASMQFFDAAGRKIHEIKGNFIQGRNEVIVKNSDLNTKGVVWYQLTTSERIETRQMVVE